MTNDIYRMGFVAILTIASIGLIVFLGHTRDTFKCPEAYSSQEGYRADLAIFIKKFLDKNPEGTLEDLSNERTVLLERHNCKKTLSSFNATTDDSHRYYAHNLGFSFKYPDGFSVSVDPDTSERLFITPESLQKNQDTPFTAIVISTTESAPSVTPLDWIKGPHSGYDISNGYTTRKVDGQEAFILDGGDWIVFTSPDGKEQISIALIPQEDANLRDNLLQILDSFFFDLR